MEMKSSERIVDVSTRIVPLTSEPLNWQLDNFELFLNAQVNAITQRFGPFHGDSTELWLSLHNEDRDATERGKCTLKIQVNRLTETKKQKMNLCGQIEIDGHEKWSRNFSIPLDNLNEASTTFDFPMHLLKEETKLQFRMKYLSRQFMRHFTVNPERSSSDATEANNEKLPIRASPPTPSISGLITTPSTSCPKTSTKSTNIPAVSKQSKLLQTENVILYSMKKIKKKVQHKWTSMEADKTTTEQQTDQLQPELTKDVKFELDLPGDVKLELELPGGDVKVEAEETEISTPDTELTEIEENGAISIKSGSGDVETSIEELREYLCMRRQNKVLEAGTTPAGAVNIDKLPRKSKSPRPECTNINNDELQESLGHFSGAIKMTVQQRKEETDRQKFFEDVVRQSPTELQGSLVDEERSQHPLIVYSHHGGPQICTIPTIPRVCQKVQPTHKEKSTMTNRCTKNKEQQTSKIGNVSVTLKNTERAKSSNNASSQANFEVPNLPTTTPNPMNSIQKQFKNASTDTLKFRKSKFQQTEDSLLLSYLEEKKAGIVPKAFPPTSNISKSSPSTSNISKSSPSTSNISKSSPSTSTNSTSSQLLKSSKSTKTKWSQTDGFLFVDLTLDLHAYIYSLPIHFMAKMKLHNFVLTLAKFSRLQDVTEVINEKIRYDMAGQFIQQMLKLMDLYEKCEQKDGNPELKLFGDVMEHAKKNHRTLLEEFTKLEEMRAAKDGNMEPSGDVKVKMEADIDDYLKCAGGDYFKCAGEGLKKLEASGEEFVMPAMNEEEFVMPEKKRNGRLSHPIISTFDELVTQIRRQSAAPVFTSVTRSIAQPMKSSNVQPKTSSNVHPSTTPNKVHPSTPTKIQPVTPVKPQPLAPESFYPSPVKFQPSPLKIQPSTPTQKAPTTPANFQKTPTTPKRRASTNLPSINENMSPFVSESKTRRQLNWKQQQIEEKLDVFWEKQRELQLQIDGDAKSESPEEEEYQSFEKDGNFRPDKEILKLLADDFDSNATGSDNSSKSRDYTSNTSGSDNSSKSGQITSNATRSITFPFEVVDAYDVTETGNFSFGAFNKSGSNDVNVKQDSPDHKQLTSNNVGFKQNSPATKIPPVYENPFGSADNQPLKLYRSLCRSSSPNSPTTTDSGSAEPSRHHSFTSKKPSQSVQVNNEVWLMPSLQVDQKLRPKENDHPAPKTSTKRHRVPVRNSQLLQKIQEARTEIASHQNRPECSLPLNVQHELDSLNGDLNRCVHEILTYSCSSDMDPVKLHEFERRLRSHCYQMDGALRSIQKHPADLQHYGNSLRQVQHILFNLEMRLMPWRRFLDMYRRIPEAQQNFGEILTQMEGIRTRDAIETLADLDISLKECRDQIQLARQSIPLLTTHVRKHLMQMEDDQGRLEASCAQILSQLRLQHQCFPSAGPWLSPKMAVIKIEKISKGAYDNDGGELL